MDGVGEDYDFGNIFLGQGLVNATSDSKQLSFWTSDKSHMMQCFDKRVIQYVCM